jgi:hypothetical protein
MLGLSGGGWITHSVEVLDGQTSDFWVWSAPVVPNAQASVMFEILLADSDHGGQGISTQCTQSPSSLLQP